MDAWIMTDLTQDLYIELLVSPESDIRDVARVIRKFGEISLSEISRSLVGGTALYKKTLIKQNFYKGWSELCQLADSLTDQSIGFCLTVNHRRVESGFLKDLKQLMNSLKKSDIF